MTTGIRRIQHGRIRVGAGGAAVRGSAAVARRRALCRRHGVAADGVWPCVALAACACPDPLDRRDRRQGRTGRARRADRGGLGGIGLGRPAVGYRQQAARRFACLSAALPGIGQGSGALGRGLRRLCRCRERASGGRRGRIDRCRIRAAAGGRFDRRCNRARRAARLGRLPRQYLFRLSRRRQGGDRRRLRQCRACRPAQIRHQPGDRGDDGAAGLHRGLQRGGRPLHDLHDAAAHPRLSLRIGPADPQGAGKQGARRRRRHRRQLWHEIGDLQRGCAGIAGLQADEAAGQMDEHANRGFPRRRAGARQRHRGRAGARPPTAIFSVCGSARSPPSAPTRRPAPTPLSPISEPWPASTARRRCMPT